MPMWENMNRNYRILYVFLELLEGRCVKVEEVARQFQVNKRTVLRDIADIRAVLADQMVWKGESRHVVYDKSRKGYLMIKSMGGNPLSNV